LALDGTTANSHFPSFAIKLLITNIDIDTYIEKLVPQEAALNPNPLNLTIMTVLQELNSWMSPPALQLSPVPKVGSTAPLSPKLPTQNADGKPTIISFLRHCGCPCTSPALHITFQCPELRLVISASLLNI
jgi:hypothetical protein